MQQQLGSYEVVPFRMSLPMTPVFPGTRHSKIDETQQLSNGASPWPPVIGAKSLPTTCAEAEKRGDGRLRECRRLASQHCWTEFLRLLEEFPALAIDREVAQGLAQAARYGRLRRRRGRPVGSFDHHPLWFVGLVRSLLDGGQATSNEEAFRQVAAMCHTPVSCVHSAFYSALNEQRFRALLLKGQPSGIDYAAPAGADALDLLQRAERLQTGVKLSRTIQHDELGAVDVIFEGLASAPPPRRERSQSLSEQVRRIAKVNPFLYGSPTNE